MAGSQRGQSKAVIKLRKAVRKLGIILENKNEESRK